MCLTDFFKLCFHFHLILGFFNFPFFISPLVQLSFSRAFLVFINFCVFCSLYYSWYTTLFHVIRYNIGFYNFLYSYVCLFIHCIHVYMHAHGGQRFMSCVFITHSMPYFLRLGLSLKLEAHYFSYASCSVNSSYPHDSVSTWDYRCGSLCPDGFYVGSWDLN